MTGIKVPSFYSTTAINPLAYAEQQRKRKLLWSKAKDNEKEVRAIKFFDSFRKNFHDLIDLIKLIDFYFYLNVDSNKKIDHYRHSRSSDSGKSRRENS